MADNLERSASRRQDGVQQWTSVSLIVLFLGLLWLPLGRYLSGRESRHDLSENRYLNPVPPLRPTLASLTAFPAGFEAHYNDHFGCRRKLIDWYARTKYLGLGDSTSRYVMPGRNGWLFFAWGPEGNYARFSHSFADVELAQWARLHEARRRWLAERQCRYHVTVAPEKQSVHCECLPERLKERLQSGTRFEQFRDYLREHTHVSFLDLREPLRQHSKGERLYLRTDAHWNDLGAYYAYVHIMQSLAADFPGLQPLPRSAFNETILATRGGDLATLLGVADAIRDEDHQLRVTSPRAKKISAAVPVIDKYCMAGWRPIVYEQPDPSLPRAVLAGDSFCWRLLPWLAEHFSRLVYLPEYVLDQRALESERPAVVICEMAERHLDTLQPEDPLLEDR